MCAADDGTEDDQLHCFHEHKSGIRLLRSGRDSQTAVTAATPDAQSESGLASSACSDSNAQPCTSSAADDLGLDMSVDEIDDSEDEKNEVFVDNDDSDVE